MNEERFTAASHDDEGTGVTARTHGPSGQTWKGTFRRMLPRRSILPTFYDLYQTLIAIIGMVGVNRILFDFAWSRAIGYALCTVLAYWAGQGLVVLLQRSAKTSAD
jgi:hypothetical protein